MTDEEFKGRDARGLLPKGNSEADARNFYWILFGKLLLCQAPAMALVAQLGASALLPGQAEAVALRLAFVREHGLGFVYVAWYIVYATKVYLTLNANGARGPARLDRPDQHIYRTADGSLVAMANEGDAGRFSNHAAFQILAYTHTSVLPVALMLLSSPLVQIAPSAARTTSTSPFPSSSRVSSCRASSSARSH